MKDSKDLYRIYKLETIEYNLQQNLRLFDYIIK